MNEEQGDEARKDERGDDGSEDQDGNQDRSWYRVSAVYGTLVRYGRTSDHDTCE